MKPAQLFTVCMLALVAGIHANPMQAAPQLNQDLQWQTDIEQAKAIAAREDKLVLLHFGASWCRPCKSLETFVFTSKDVQNVIAANVVPVKLDADTATAAVNEYDVQMVPYDVVITPGGRVVSRRRSPSDAGNYALMISKLATANRKLKGNNHGNLGHQIERVQNRYAKLQADQSGDFRPDAPSHESMGLSKDGSMLARRQSAFGDDPKSQENPWVAPKTGSPVRSQAKSWSASPPSWDDQDRKQFLEQQQPLPSQGYARRAEPQRILNPAYFEAVKQRQQGTYVQSKPATKKTKPNFEIIEGSADSEPMQLAGPSTAAAPEMSLTLNEPELPPATAFVPQAMTPTETESPMEIKTPVATAAPEAKKEEVAVKTETEPLDRSKFCLYGKCPVTLIKEGRWVDGDSKFGIVHRDRVFLFADADKLAEFKKNPDELSPILAGFDPVVYHEQGQLTDGLAENGVFMGKAPEHRVILFSSAETRAKFQDRPSLYLGTVRQAMQQVAPGTAGTVVR